MSDPLKVKVSFDYYPDEPDPDDETGMSEDEYDDLMRKVIELGGGDIQFKKVSP